MEQRSPRPHEMKALIDAAERLAYSDEQRYDYSVVPNTVTIPAELIGTLRNALARIRR